MALVTASSNLATPIDKGLIVRPSGVSGLMNSIFVSTATKASRMLVAAASAAVATGEGERWRPMNTVRYLVMLTIWANVWVLRIVTDIFPPSPAVLSLLDFGVDGLIDRKPSSSTAIVLHGGSGSGLGANSTAIGRALSHILVILNELPYTSRKYEFVLSTADRVLTENVQLGHAELLEVNRAVLASAFSRTSELLRRALQRSSSITATWPSRVLSLFPLGPRLATLYDGLRLCLGGLLPSAAVGALRPYKRHRPVTASVNEWLDAEKLAHELLWITNKLRASSAAGEAIVRWAFASGLASLSLTAHPRVQSLIVKITVVLLRELARGEWEAATEVRFGILALWLPLLCYASSGVTTPVLTGMERWEVERVIEDLVAGLPLEDQEIILRNWLEDFSASDSDWPNLSRAFDRWCRYARKLLC
ncbi:BTB/POZ domain-containing protein [Cocos nucifera]|uniref:BTB/POZ domain-containing protein n=1 Tax=Cocos nucifera TaxID=13894 RepID=A0A8K0N6Q5_COCNU|nr:BTB/POZ domain-containing protein [Cocos nucifera]